MKKTFFFNLVYLVFINLLVKPFYIFGIDRTIQNSVVEGDYGIYYTLFNFTLLFQIINDFGIQQFNNRTIAQHRQLIDKYFPNVLVLKLGLSIAYCILVSVVAYWMGYLPQYAGIFFFFLLNHILISLIAFLRSNISGLGFYYIDSTVSILDRLLLITICGILLWNNPFQQDFQIEWFVYAQSISLSVTAIIAFIIVFKHLKRLVFRFNPAFLILILKKSYPYALLVFLMTAYTRLDSVMIDQLLENGQVQNDIYAAAYRILDALNMFVILSCGLLYPMFSRLFKENKNKLVSLYRFSLLLLIGGIIPIAGLIYYYKISIMDILYVRATPYWGELFGWLILSWLPMAIIQLSGALLLAKGTTKRLLYIYALGVFFNIVGNIILIPHYEAIGATITTLITQSIVALILLAETIPFQKNLSFVKN